MAVIGTRVPPLPKPDNVTVQRFSRINLGATPVHGGRQICQDSTGMIWHVWAEQSDGGTYRVWANYALENPQENDARHWCSFPENVVSGAFMPQALAICVDQNDEPMVLVVIVAGGTYYCYPYQRISGTWTVRTAQALNKKVEWISFECDSSGNFHVLYPDYDASNRHSFVYRKTSDHFVTWSSATYLEAQTGNDNGTPGYNGTEARGALAVDSIGDLHAVYCFVDDSDSSWNLVYQKKPSAGSWGSYKTIESIPVLHQYSVSLSQRMVSLAIDQDDVPHVVYVRGNKGEWATNSTVYYANRVGGTWSTPQLVTDEYPQDWEYPALSLEMQPDVDQIAHVVVCGITDTGSDQTDRYVYHIKYDGTDWGTAYTIYKPEAGTSATNGQALHMIGPVSQGNLTTGYLVGFSAGSVAGIFWPTNIVPRNEGKAAETLTISEVAAGVLTDINVSVTEELQVIEAKSVYGIYFRTISDTLHVSESSATNMLVRETLTVSETLATAGSVWNRSASDTLTLSESALASIPGRCETDFTPDPDILASWDDRLYTVLAGPYGAQTQTVYLPRPNWTDQRTLDTRVVTQRNRALQPLQFTKNDPLYRLRLSWRGLSRRKILELDDFLDNMRGRTVAYKDHEDIDWQVIITSSPVPLTYGDAKDYDNELELELQGVQVTA